MPDIFSADSAEHSSTSESGEVATVDETAETPYVPRDVEEYSMVMREENSSDNPFKSFVAKPHKIFFSSQHHEEKVLLLLRRHPITQVGWILIAILLCFMPTLFEMVGLFDFMPLRYQFAARIGWFLIVTGYILESFLTWFYNVYIITDERVIDVDFYNLLFKNISAAKTDNIEDVTSASGGVLASMFNYGTVKIQTAGAVTEFDFEDVPQPAKVTAFINELIIEEEKERLSNKAN